MKWEILDSVSNSGSAENTSTKLSIETTVNAKSNFFSAGLLIAREAILPT